MQTPPSRLEQPLLFQRRADRRNCRSRLRFATLEEPENTARYASQSRQGLTGQREFPASLGTGLWSDRG